MLSRQKISLYYEYAKPSDKESRLYKKRLMDLYLKFNVEQRKIFIKNASLGLKRINNASNIINTFPKHYTYAHNKISRKSDTLFILGSGPSINELSPSNFQKMAAYDSWGFNFWLVHDYVPDVYFAQFNLYKKKESADIWLSCFNKRYNAYSKSSIIFKGGTLDYIEYFKSNSNIKHISSLHKNSIGLLSVCNIPDLLGEPSQLNKIFNNMKNLGLVSYNSGIINPAMQIRSTLGLMVTLALNCGFKNIVFCGIDGYDNSHFFDNKYYINNFPELKKLVQASHAKGRFHPHTYRKGSFLSSNQVVSEYAKFAMSEYNIKFYVSSARSWFNKYFPVFTF